VGEHLEAAKRQGASVEEAPDMPSELVYLWNHFRDLHRARSANGFGPNPIAWAEIDAYNRLAALDLGAWEIDAIRLMDDLFLMASYKKD
jgi:hypothetical protein